MKKKKWNIQAAWPMQFFAALALVFVWPVVSTAVDVGEKAPDFELKSTTGGQIRLGEFAGKKNVLIEFYIMDFSPGCEKAHQTRRLAYEKFQARDTEVLGVGVFSPWSQLAFAKTLNLPYPLLSDFPDLKTIKAYGVEQKIGDIPTAKRAYFIVDKRGIVRFKRIVNPFDVDGPYLQNDVLLSEVEKINKRTE